MAANTFDSILKELKKKVYQPVYFLQGEEPYFIDQIASFVEHNVLSDGEKEFNQTVLYGRDVDTATILSYAKRYPMMSNYHVVIVREAQDVKDLIKKKQGEDEDETNVFIDYLNNPQKTTVLVFCYKNKKIDKRTKVGKAIEKHSVFFDSKRIYDDKIAGWISAYIKNKGYKIQSDATLLLAEYLGTDLSKVANELEKLMINVAPNHEINTTQIERDIGISKDYNVFELQKALGVKDVLKVQRIVNYFGANSKSNPLVLIISTLNQFFTKLITYHLFKNNSNVNLSSVMGINSFFIRDFQAASRFYNIENLKNAINVLHEYDLKSKGVNSIGVSEHDLLRELIYKILHPEPVKTI